MISTCQHGPVMQRGWDLRIRGKRKLKAKRGGETRVCASALKCGGRALTGLTHALTLTALGEENRSSYPRGPREGETRGGEGGELPEAALPFDAGTRKG